MAKELTLQVGSQCDGKPEGALACAEFGTAAGWERGYGFVEGGWKSSAMGGRGKGLTLGCQKFIRGIIGHVNLAEGACWICALC